MIGSVRKDIPDVGEWSEDPPWMTESGPVSVLDVREWSRNPFGCPEGTLGCPVVFGRPSPMTGRPSRMSRSGRVSVPDVQEW